MVLYKGVAESRKEKKEERRKVWGITKKQADTLGKGVQWVKKNQGATRASAARPNW